VGIRPRARFHRITIRGANPGGHGPRRLPEPERQSLAAGPSQNETRCLRRSLRHRYVDLSAIAKGYAVDALSSLLEGQRIASYLVEIGGELRARGSKPGGSPWKVAIERPLPGKPSVQNVVALRDNAVATSGGYRNYVEIDGKRLSHTIDPRTGRPVDHGLASVSVITPTAMRADALATALMVMGPEEGYRLAEREALAAHLITRNGDELRVLTTPRFETYLLR